MKEKQREMQIEQYPWQHIIIDNYFDSDYYDMLATKNINPIGKKSKLYKFDNQKREPFKYDPSKVRYDIFSFLNFFDSVREYSGLDMISELVESPPNFTYPVHDENLKKVLSIVVYLSPEESKGTYIYNRRKEFVKEIEWKPNRAFIFCAEEGLTWHNYESGNDYRKTACIFLTRSTHNFCWIK